MAAPKVWKKAVKPTKAEHKRRLAQVELVMAERGWNGRIVRALAREFQVREGTIHKYRREVLDDLAAGYRGPSLEEARAEFMSRLRGHQSAAKAAGQFGPVSSMMAIESKVAGLEVASQHEVRVEHSAATVDDLAEARARVASRLLAARKQSS